MPRRQITAKRTRALRATAAGLSLIALGAAPTSAVANADVANATDAASAPTTHVALTFSGRFAGFRVMRATVDATLEPQRYDASLMFRSAGVIGFFKTARVEAQGSGSRDAQGFHPSAYTHVEITGRKRREVTFTYAPDDVDVAATPRFGSLGDPAPTPAQKREAFDPMAAVLQIAHAGGAHPCDRVVPVFDSKLRYDFVFEPDSDDGTPVITNVRTRAYRGPAHRCRVFYRPLAGYDAEDLASDEVYATPLRLWIAEVAPGVTAPVLIRAHFGARILPFDIKIELVGAEVTTSS